jgi:hypothetical protein
MKFLGFLWATLCIVGGTAILLDAFGIVKNIPVFELTIALVLITIGINQLVSITTDKKI